MNGRLEGSVQGKGIGSCRVDDVLSFVFGFVIYLNLLGQV